MSPATTTDHEPPLVLSLFPGIGLLDMAFEEEGFCVVRGPDCLWGGDVRRFHPPAGRFDGVIGGPPCQCFSPLVNINLKRYGRQSIAKNLIPEFERCVEEARPAWFVMENVPRSPLPVAEGYQVCSQVIDNADFGQHQKRVRKISFGTPDGREFSVQPSGRLLFNVPTVTGSAGGRRAVLVRDAAGRVHGKQGSADWHRLGNRSVAEMCELQGLPKSFLDGAPFSVEGKRRAIANGVPLPMGRAIARAVKEAIRD